MTFFSQRTGMHVNQDSISGKVTRNKLFKKKLHNLRQSFFFSCPSLQNFLWDITPILLRFTWEVLLLFRRLYETIIRGLPQFQVFSGQTEGNMLVCGSGKSKRTHRKCHTKTLAGELQRNRVISTARHCKWESLFTKSHLHICMQPTTCV